TWLSSCLSSCERASTQLGRQGSMASTLPHRRDTTAMAECRVSLCTREPLSRMKDRTHCRPPASNTAPASRVQISSSTCQTHQMQARTLTHCSARSLLVREDTSATTRRLHMALTAPSTATMRRVHSADTSR
ncbi:unnamed protein product, partial [Ixodes pacificus]